MHPQQNIQQHRINSKKPGSVAFYDLRPGNGTGLFSKKWL